jgi:pteridine reductase
VPTALVTGVGIRVGRAIAEALAQAGYDLLLHANRSREAVDEVAERCRSLGRQAEVYTADLSDPAARSAFAREASAAAPALDVLVHNAGLFEKLAFEDIGLDTYRRMQAVNVEAPFFLSQALLPNLRLASGSIVHLTDIGGERPIACYAHYSVSKAALIMLTRALAAELAPAVRVNAVSPGTVIFPEDFDEATRRAFLARIPLGREGQGDDVAKAVLFLVRDAPYITGQVLSVDGGRSSVL